MLSAVSRLSRAQKTIVLLSLDSFLIPFSLFVAIGLRTGTLWSPYWLASGTPLFAVLPVIGIVLSLWLRIPTTVLSAFESRGILKIGLLALNLTVAGIFVNTLAGTALPRSVPLIFGTLFVVFCVLARFALICIRDRLANAAGKRKRVAIYGAGSAGQALLAALRNSDDRNPVALIDDNPSLRRAQIGGLQVRGTENLAGFIEGQKISEIVFALPSVDSARRREILARLTGLGCDVLELPHIGSLLDGRARPDQLQNVSPEFLLGRAPVDLQLPDIRAAYAGRSVMVTGAGGSIGSELCRQIMAVRPGKIVLFEQSEFALYTIDMELRRHPYASAVEIYPVLGSVCDFDRVAAVLQEHGTEIILHSAAYKHVPLVEANVLEGARNNVLGTLSVAEAARAHGVARFILVSTDKAVRPRNIMGASKRLAEMFVQNLQLGGGQTVFSMVRFGNVLGSSGSVVPLFQRQIREGGPLTLTDREVTRYFMTKTEAAQLVLLAGSYSEGGEVFVLDMGKPIRIADLARNLIELSGLTVRNADNPDGDIEIVTTGLRPGEKLYEELLEGDNVIATPHPKILRAIERFPSEMELASARRRLSNALQMADARQIRDIFEHLIDGFAPLKPEVAV